VTTIRELASRGVGSKTIARTVGVARNTSRCVTARTPSTGLMPGTSLRPRPFRDWPTRTTLMPKFERALKSALLSDGGEDALARGKTFDTSVRRKMYDLLTARDTTSKRRMLDAALNDPDAVIRARAIRSIAVDLDFGDRAATLERFLHDDRVPAVRRLALAVLSEHVPERLGAVFPQVLLDRAASVRGLARFVAGTQLPALVPRTVYIGALVGKLPGRLAAAIEGVGETGSRADPAFLLEALRDPDDSVRASSARLLDRWIESFNRNQTQPSANQLQRIDALLDSVASRMPEATARMLRFSSKSS
jgi:HEAT repeat protein